MLLRTTAADDAAHTPCLDRTVLVVHRKLALGGSQHTVRQLGKDHKLHPVATAQPPCPVA
jgi:hypothetical protein